MIPVAALARAKYIITAQASLSAGLYVSSFLQNSAIVKPIGNIQKNEHNRKEQPGEKLYGVEDFDIVVHFLGFGWTLASAWLQHCLHLMFSWDPDRFLPWRWATSRGMGWFVVVHVFLCSLECVFLAKKEWTKILDIWLTNGFEWESSYNSSFKNHFSISS